jgi:signal transduction histidine kinase
MMDLAAKSSAHSLISRLRRRFDALVEPLPAASPKDVEAFGAAVREQGFRNWRLFLAFVAFCVVLWWPLDFVVVPESSNLRDVFMVCRITVFLTATAAFFGVTHPRLRPHGVLIMGVAGVIICFVSGWQFGRIAGPSAPWFHFGHLVVLPPIGLTLSPSRRFLLTALYALSWSSGFFGINPEHLRDPLVGLALSFQLFTTVFATVAGIATDRLRFRAFVLLRTSNRQAEELRLLKDDLERRVAERTHEVRRLSAHLETAREGERQALARELHDELGQELTALRYAFELLRRRYGNDPQSITANIADVDSMMARTRLATRAIVAELRPRVLDDLGLAGAAEGLVRRAGERADLEATIDTPHDLPAPTPEVATAAYRILQECLTNVAKHAGAQKVAVTLGLDGRGDAIAMRVVDDGVGFDPAQAKSGFGLLGMRERAAAAGISLVIRSSPGSGTCVDACIPLPPNSVQKPQQEQESAA